MSENRSIPLQIACPCDGRGHCQRCEVTWAKARAIALSAVRHSGLSPADREDVIQETLASAFLARERYRQEKASVETWLKAIARNRVIDHSREADRAPQPATDKALSKDLKDGRGVSYRPALHSPEALAVERVRQAELEAQLPRDFQPVASLVVEGWSVREACRKVDPDHHETLRKELYRWKSRRGGIS